MLAFLFGFLVSPAFSADPPADLVARGVVSRASPASPDDLKRLYHALDGKLYLPPGAEIQVCAKVEDIWKGELFGDEVCFFRANRLAFSPPMPGGVEVPPATPLVFLLTEASSGLLYATAPGAVIPVDRLAAMAPEQAAAVKAGTLLPVDNAADASFQLRIARGDPGVIGEVRALFSGSPAERKQAADIVATFGLLELIPDLIAAIADPTPVPVEGTPIGRPMGVVAAETLVRIAPTLDGNVARTEGSFERSGLDWKVRVGAVQKDWQGWWSKWSTRT